MSLAACAPPPLEFNPDTVPIVNRKVPAALNHVSLRFATSDRKLGDTSLATEIQTDFQLAFVSALENAVLQSLAFKPSSNNHVLLEVEVLKLGGAGKLGIAEMIANYKIVNIESGSIIFDRNITSSGKIGLNTALRLDYRGIAPTMVNDVTRNNILSFLTALNQR